MFKIKVSCPKCKKRLMDKIEGASGVIEIKCPHCKNVVKIQLHKIKDVENTEYQTLLELRYLNFKTWEQIAVEMNYELRWLYRIHNKALDAVFETSH